MLMPSIFTDNLFDDWFDDFSLFDNRDMRNVEKKLYGHHASRLMKTDIKEHDHNYEIIIDLPGFSKDQIKASVDNGYLTIQASKGLDKDEKDKETGKYLRQERYAGSLERSFYVGDNVKQEDIKASFEHGLLRLTIPKVETKKLDTEKQYICIE